MKNSQCIILCVLALVGCATQKTHLEERAPDGTVKISDTVTTTFFDGKSELAKLKTSHTKATQSIGITGLEQESSGTNAVALIQAVVEAAVKAAVKP